MTATRMTSARIRRAALAAAAALAVFTALPASTAHAADGTFFYHSSQSGDLEIDDPDNGECYLLLQGASSVRNRTDAVARVYYDQGCEELADTLVPGDGRTFTEPLARSVTFG
ncbi:hypothetical protein [Streptomyces sp. MNP-20]|uniref:hypothetical protein n=1 Tax=Streptomyces sp. MNP-20 TaxID=2721165 RepID=UPI001555939C|nr:hypothetical protein [Streptomyces sp. MNP-20]